MSNGIGNLATEFRFRDENGDLLGDLVPIDFAKSAEGYGVKTYTARTLEQLENALRDSLDSKVSTLIDIKVLPKTMTDGYGAWWNVGVASTSDNKAVNEAYKNKKKTKVKRGNIDMLDKNKVKLGIAPIAWTNDDMPDLGSENTFEQCISEMALAGFTGCEVGNKYPRDDIPALKKALSLRNMQICNAWFSSFLLTKPYDEVEKDFTDHISFLKEMGARVVGISEQSYSIQGTDKSVFKDKYIMNDDEWARLCDGVNRLGKVAKDMGIALTYHHHMGTVVQTAAEIDRLMENTDPELFSLLYDSGHLAYCGEDYIGVLKKYANRVKHVHLKDIRPEVIDKVKKENLSFLEGVRLGTFTVPGDGAIDFGPIFDILADSGYEGYVLVEAEQDPAKANPFEYALKARAYIREKSGL